MFTADERVRLQQRLLARAEADTCIVGAAFTGSYALERCDPALAGRLRPMLAELAGSDRSPSDGSAAVSS